MKESKEREALLKEIQAKISSEDILDSFLTVLSDKQAKDSSCYKIDGISTLADYMVITSTTSSTQLKVIADEIQKTGRNSHFMQLNAGEPVDEDWSVLDFGTVIVHLFSREARERYKLDELWSGGEIINLDKWFDKPNDPDPA